MTPLRRDLVCSASSSSVPFPDFANVSLAEPVAPHAIHGDAPEMAVATSARYGVKLVFDRILAFLALVFLGPLMLVIAALIRLESPGPALFKQERVGFRQRSFNCYKFRSMYHHLQDERVTRQATRGDVRITRFGRMLRRLSLDELPQLLNVLKGDMSLVGPRPHAPETRAAGRTFPEIVPFYHRRHCVLPGITGWAQVNGWRGETRCAADIETRVRYDLEYIYGWSLLFDLRVLALTLVRLLNDETAV